MKRTYANHSSEFRSSLWRHLILSFSIFFTWRRKWWNARYKTNAVHFELVLLLAHLDSQFRAHLHSQFREGRPQFCGHFTGFLTQHKQTCPLSKRELTFGLFNCESFAVNRKFHPWSFASWAAFVTRLRSSAKCQTFESCQHKAHVKGVQRKNIDTRPRLLYNRIVQVS